ncbi:MAG: acetate--CoA ligase [Rhodospirillaceae bacterium]|nr:acetate--CoA ligase [Rhodospirillaceae bacterium]|tara:strand:+ start:2876 stop:4807 length:1932 start_codon:yes stop_codon:yes gene_type:complete
MAQEEQYPVNAKWSANAWINEDSYTKMYQSSIDDPVAFWKEQGKRLTWIKSYKKIKDVSFKKSDLHIRWFYDGTLNASANCLDRHLTTRGEQTAIIWEGDEPGQSKKITYRQLYKSVCKCANAMTHLGIKKGDRVTIYLPMIPEIAISVLACARIGAIHSVVFGGFSPDAIAGRIKDCDSEYVITSDEGIRGGKTIPLKNNMDSALKKCPGVKKCIVVNRTGGPISWIENRDVWWHDLLDQEPEEFPPAEMNAEDPLFILYTSGSTGKPKGVLHTTGGYMVYASMTHQYIFDYHEGDIYWCTADIGWITGHSYILYGPLANGATTLMFEGIPTYPNASRFWQICDKYDVNIFYTAPTALRALMREGDNLVKCTKRSKLRLLGTVGEPINPEAWKWYFDVVGEKQCPIVDTWWQTETGGIMISPLPGATALKPGSATRPFFGIKPELCENDGTLVVGAGVGNLCISDSWPGQMRTVFRDHNRFYETYFSQFPGKYFSGDGCRRDEHDYYWITGRVDDVINVSGHRIGTAEVESALVAHHKVAEAAVVGFPHEIRGQGIYAFVTLMKDDTPSAELKKELVEWVRSQIGPIASPDYIQWAPGLPKTRSGKIMRRILRKIAANEFDDLGDITTLADPSVVTDLKNSR